MTDRDRSLEGMVTVEASLVFLVLTVFIVTLIGGLSLIITKMHAIDCARDSTLSKARGDSIPSHCATGLSVHTDGGIVYGTVTLRAPYFHIPITAGAQAILERKP